MLPGRRRLPANVHELRGTARPDRVNPNAPVPATLEVGSKPPTWLKDVRRKRSWKGLVELLQDQRVLTVMDAASLAMLVDAFGDYLEASDLVAGVACGFCGDPLASKRPCTAAIEVEAEADAGAERTVVRLPHEPGRRYYTTRTKEGSFMIRPHPAMAVRQDAWKRVVGLLGHFGMTPATRAKVTVGGPAERDPMTELLEDFG